MREFDRFGFKIGLRGRCLWLRGEIVEIVVIKVLKNGGMDADLWRFCRGFLLGQDLLGLLDSGVSKEGSWIDGRPPFFFGLQRLVFAVRVDHLFSLL